MAGEVSLAPFAPQVTSPAHRCDCQACALELDAAIQKAPLE